MSLFFEEITQRRFRVRQMGIPVVPLHGEIGLVDRDDYALRLDGFEHHRFEQAKGGTQIAGMKRLSLISGSHHSPDNGHRHPIDKLPANAGTDLKRSQRCKPVRA